MKQDEKGHCEGPELENSESEQDGIEPTERVSAPAGIARRDLLRKAALAGAAGVVAGCGGSASDGSAPAVQTKPNLNWRLASSFPRSLDTIYGAAEVFANRVETLSEGRFRIRCYPSPELVPALQVLDAVQQGTVQVGHTASYYYTGKHPALAFDTAVPFGLTSRQQTAWLYEAGGLDLMREVFADFGILNLPGGNTGAQMGGWFRREVPSLSALNGLKMRIPGLGGEVMSRLGVTVQTISGGEIYPALERGAIDATEWVGPYDDEKLGFHQIAKYYYYPGWWEPGPNLSLYFNRKSWDGLPSSYQEILVTAAKEAHLVTQSRYDALNPMAIDKILAHGVQLRAFSRDIMEAAQRETIALMEEIAAKEPTYDKIFRAWKAYRQQSLRWFATAELAYQDFAFSPHRPGA
jgi:TRAP-type mannitol/chloroaromatic compound transport system substrate-binding protein